MSTKICKRCKQRKDISLFYVHSKMADKHLNFCKLCTRKRVSKYSKINREKILAYDRERNKTEHRKEYGRIRNKKRAIQNPGKNKLYKKVSNAIRDGRLVRQSCEICGEPNAQAHHDDYRSPFKIKWLCKKHHYELHHPPF